MTVSEARRYLAGPLVFGDPYQVNARKFLEKVEEAKEAVRACRADHGDFGKYRSNDDMLREILACDCLEEIRLHDDERDEAARALVREWKHDR